MEVLAGRYHVRVAPGTLERKGYLAGDDERRADDLNVLLRDPDVRAIVLARGGYGLMRILDLLDADALRRDPKLIVGFSDATSLLAWALVRANVRCIHGPMVAQIGELPADDVAWLFQMMETKQPAGELGLGLEPMGARPPGASPMDAAIDAQAATVVEGRLLGGNLCLLSHLLGTPYSLDFTGAVLVLEEIGERPYRLDRYLTHLGLAGVLGKIKACVIGDLTDCNENVHKDHPTALEVVDERLRRYGVLGLHGAPLAHGTRNLALPLDIRCAVEPGQGTLHLLEAAVV